MLHIVCSSDGLNSCVSYVRHKDAVLFIGDATKYAKSMACSHTYVIESDSCHEEASTLQGVISIGYDEFVDLVVAHTSSVSWS